jgi:hypothetical protein
LWDIIRNDRTSHKIDLKLAKIALEQELKTLIKKENLNKQENTENVFNEVYKKFK